ncbi:prepilin peptidase CpaA [Novimethylophilus kurashikiensis]|uniref:Prepilin peptidase CpaA n=1 Tax=Novimethylophilus kurashikiensis TaxID=1825523 RepID=A0A2R5F6E6_9PROT|nr:A24 family peptidase [Novimethylophilus kurashikiensis]GBG13148.1 prepilin peptidase CpaA [Novimethylophilus kurashikiensis]
MDYAIAQQLAAALLASLGLLLFIATWIDLKSHRIPNALVLLGILIGVLGNGLAPAGFGFNSEVLPGGLGWWMAFKGMGYGLMMMLPFYVLRAMGAGDVKLMAMVGAYVGPGTVIGVVVSTFVIGGIMALVVAARSGELNRVLENVRWALFGFMMKSSTGQITNMSEGTATSQIKLPYALAISLGTLWWLAWQRMSG